MSHVRVRPSYGFGSLKLPELIERRDLFYSLAWSDVKVAMDVGSRRGRDRFPFQ